MGGVASVMILCAASTTAWATTEAERTTTDAVAERAPVLRREASSEEKNTIMDAVRGRLATKTAYASADGAARVFSETPPPAGCGEATFVNVVARHGTRHSSKIARLDALAARLGLPWRYPGGDASQASLLTPRGREEHYELARRLRARYPLAFASVVSPASRTTIRATSKSRAVQSAEAFALGAFDYDDDDDPALVVTASGGVPAENEGSTRAFRVEIPAANDSDRQLRFFDHCAAHAAWEAALERNATSEYARYLASDEFEAALAAFRRRVGRGVPNEAGSSTTTESSSVSAADLLLAYEGCAYDVVVADADDRWCGLVADHVAVLEYAKDLDEWYENGPGNPVARTMPVELLRDLVAAFDDAVASSLAAATEDDVRAPNTTRRRSALRFAHAETLLPLATMLGLFDAQPAPTAARLDDARRFRTSVVAPMAANLVATLHPCGGASASKVKVLYNEREVVLPACAAEGVYCDLATLKRAFHDALHVWDFDALCGNAD